MIALLMFVAVCALLLAGYPVALTLGGVALWFALGGILAGALDFHALLDFPSRLFGTMTNETLMAVPLFVLMGVVLERARLAEDLLEAMAELFGARRGGLAFSVVLVGTLLAASTGIVGATVVTMGLLSLPTMLRRGYSPAIAAGTIAASGTLGQVIPPSIILVLLGDVLSSAYQQAQLQQGLFSTETVSVGDLFVGALLPGLGLVVLYLIYLAGMARWRGESMPLLREPGAAAPAGLPQRLLVGLLPPLVLMVIVLGSIMLGLATPTEAAAVGAGGALLLAIGRRQLNRTRLTEAVQKTAQITSMVFLILIGASMFSLVFNAYGGDEHVHDLLRALPGGVVGATLCVMVLMFLLGFVLDFIEITFVVVPIVGPVLLAMGLDPVWLGVMMAINLQTSFLTPPFGFALFYLRGVAPAEVTTAHIYQGVTPFIAIQVLMLVVLAIWPELATWLPAKGVRMNLLEWLTLGGICALGAMSPGPSLALVLRHSVHGGPRAGLAVSWAHGLGVGVYAAAAATGLALVFTTVPPLRTAVTLAGAAYLLWLAWSIVRGGGHAAPADGDGPALHRAAVDGLAMALLNPKVALFFLAIFSQFLPARPALAEQAGLALMAALIDAIWYSFVVVMTAAVNLAGALGRHAVIIDRIMAAVFVALAVVVIVRTSGVNA